MPVTGKPYKVPRELSGFTRVAQNLQDAICVTDTLGITVWVNNSFIEMCGYPADELVGKKPGDVLQGPETCPFTIQTIHDKLVLAEAIEVDILNYKKEGTPYWVNMKISPILNNKGKLNGFVSVEREISHVKAEQKQKEQLIVELYTVLCQAPL